MMGFEPMDENNPIYRIIGAAIEVHRHLGPGHVEGIYQEALALELGTRDIPFVREERIPVFYKGICLSKYYQPDFICYDEIIVELKALHDIGPLEASQVLSYLKATGFRKALLLNFGELSLTHKSFIR